MVDVRPITPEELPDQEELISILKTEGAPPFITLDLAESDGDMKGTMFVALDSRGRLVEVNGD